MSFFARADAYDRFMGRYSTPLAPEFVDFAAISDAESVLDVGCGPGALTTELVRRFGAAAVPAVDPSDAFVDAAHERHPDVDVRQATAEHLPFVDGAFRAALAQLVVHFMADPEGGVREMARVTEPDGVVAACVWDYEARQGPLNVFWEAALSLDPDAEGEVARTGARRGQLAELFEGAGLRSVEADLLSVTVDHSGFDEWWEPFTLGVGPAGAYVASLDTDRRAALRDRCRELLPTGPFPLTARAWAARGRV